MAFPIVTVVGGRVPSERQVRITIDVVAQFPDRTPARLQIQFRNEATTPRTFLFGPAPPFGPLRGDDPDEGCLHILPTEDARSFAGFYADVIPSWPRDECWQLTERSDRIDRGLMWNAGADVAIAMTYVVLDDPDAEECLSDGVYQFEGRWGEQYADATEEWFNWKFTLALKR